MKNEYSIIVAVYNIEQYIDKCVASIVGQSYENLEIILVNDGSTDSSLSKCNHWSEIDGRIKVVNKQNGGLSSARNAGLIQAKGNYILYVDGDDWLDKDLIKVVDNYLTN